MRRYHRVSDDDRAQAAALYRSGLSIDQVAQRIDRAPSVVRGILVDAGVPRRPKSCSRIPATTREQIIAAYRDGSSIRQVAAAYGTDYTTARRILTDAGVPLRRSGWPADAWRRGVAR